MFFNILRSLGLRKGVWNIMHWAGMQSSGLCVHVKRQSDVSRCGSISASEQKRRWRLRLLLGNQEADRVSGTVSLSPQATDGFGG